MKKIIYITLCIIGILSFSCEKEKIETDPKKAILGKWEIVEMGNWPNMEPIEEPLAYEEYLPDSILGEYEYKTKNSYFKKYWIEGSTLLISTLREDGFELVFKYKYDFFDNNTLRLESYSVMMSNTSIYNRLE